MYLTEEKIRKMQIKNDGMYDHVLQDAKVVMAASLPSLIDRKLRLFCFITANTSVNR